MTGLPALLMLALISALPFLTASAAHWPADAASKELTIRGTLALLDESGQVTSLDYDHRPGNVVIGLRSDDGRVYRFSMSDPLIEMVRDPQLWHRTLQLIVRPIKDRQVEIVKIQAARGGKLFDLYYYCDVCNITAQAGGPCPCCGKELELVETPVRAPDL